MKYNILVTGCGGDIGQSIGKILNDSIYVNHLYGCDVSDENAGKFIFKNFSLAPSCNSDDYLQFLEEYVDAQAIDFIIPIAEPELRFFSKRGITDNVGSAKLVMASERALEVGFDKLLTATFLEKHGLPFPTSYPLETIEEIEKFPAVLKSRSGSGSSNVHIVNDDEEFRFYKKRNKNFIVQEYLDGDHGEFTCGVFRSRNGTIRTIVLKRRLTGGFSGYGTIVDDVSINNLLRTLSEKLDLVGSINVQLRITGKGPTIFEINPRFSSTVLFRHMFGFKDVLWSIEDLLETGISDYPGVVIGSKFYKGFNEYIS